MSRVLKRIARWRVYAEFLTLRILVPVLVLALVSGCGGKSAATHMAMPPVPVLVATAVQKTVPEQLQNIGTVEAFSTVNIKTRVEGQLVAIDFKEGDFVKQGQLLFTLDPRPFEAAVAQAKATHAKDLASAHQAQLDERRYKLLLSDGVGSQQQYDQAYGVSSSLTAAAAADRAAIQNAELNLEYTQIHSPLDGRTGSLQVHIGDMIKPDNDTPMVVINQIEPIYVDFSIPEKNLAEVRRYMEQHPLETQALAPGEKTPEEGVLSFVDNAVSTTTGTIMLKGRFKNEDRRLWPGQFVNTTLTLREIPNAVLVPSEALQTGQKGAFVYVVGHDMKVEARAVVAGAQIGADTIIDNGIAKGETVVTDGQLRLAPGATVRVKSSLEAGAGTTS
ncbi:MAG: efflux RND transporter periplasmic adaptor subunit [Candidatus Binataceae bacterium]